MFCGAGINGPSHSAPRLPVAASHPQHQTFPSAETRAATLSLNTARSCPERRFGRTQAEGREVLGKSITHGTIGRRPAEDGVRGRKSKVQSRTRSDLGRVEGCAPAGDRTGPHRSETDGRGKIRTALTLHPLPADWARAMGRETGGRSARSRERAAGGRWGLNSRQGRKKRPRRGGDPFFTQGRKRSPARRDKWSRRDRPKLVPP